MSEETRSQLLKLSQTGKLEGVSKKAIDESSELQVSNALMLVENRKDLREWRSEVRDILNGQNSTLEAHGEALAEIDSTTKQTNGKVKVLRADTDALQAQVKAILDKDGQRTNAALTQELVANARKAAVDGMVMFKRPSLASACAVAASVAAVLGTLATGAMWLFIHLSYNP